MVAATVKTRQLVDWSATLWAALASGVVFLLVNLLATGITLGSPWIILRVLASLVMGEGVLPPPVTFDIGIALVALLVHFVLSFIFATLIVAVLHRWGLIVGIVGGALFGLALYAVNFYTFTLFFPWFFAFQSWIMLLAHVLFGATAGGVYELLEVEEFVTVETEGN